MGIGCFALLVAAGCFYKFAASFLAVLMWWVFFLEQSGYVNHMYLACLLTSLLVFVPADRCFSVTRWRSDATVPVWCVWLLRFQMGIVYFFGGVAKLNTGWLNGYPLRIWMHDRPPSSDAFGCSSR
ncbi:MAG: HTTM domain-containing protein [Nannocystaceae bacterium]